MWEYNLRRCPENIDGLLDCLSQPCRLQRMFTAPLGREEPDLRGDGEVFQQVPGPLSEGLVGTESIVVIAGVDPIDPQFQGTFERSRS